MRTMFLHVGDYKTGSSWIQSAFRHGRARLAAHGVHYAPGEDEAVNDPLSITSGNGTGLLDSPASFDARLAEAGMRFEGDLLYSNETLLERLAEAETARALVEIARARGFSDIRILAFVRDPMGHAASTWQQWVKDRGLTEPVEAYFARFDRPLLAARMLEHLVGRPEVSITLRNYARVRDALLPEIEAWLGLAPGALPTPPAERVNRSFTRAEIAFQLALNREAGSCPLLKHPLAERLPEIPPEDIRPSHQAQAAAWARLAPVLERVDAHLPEDQRYNFDPREPPSEVDQPMLSVPQIEAIAGSVGSEIARLRAEVSRLRDATARLRSGLARPETALGARQLLGALIRRLIRSCRNRTAS